MSYLVLARKWRPQTFEEVVGQDHVTSTLKNALKGDRLAHALIFSGPRGIGKTSVARILAKAMNCERGPAPDPCNTCGICKEITMGSSVDVQEIDGASNRGIDEIRQLRENCKFRPVRCRFKIYIIDEVHMLTKEAFNALLKTLEEPPPHVFFIFATTEPARIPATIQSRCQHYEFRRLDTSQLAGYLDSIVQKEGMNVSKRATLVLAREAEGSVRDALSLLDQVVAYGASSLAQVCEALGIVGTDTLADLSLAILNGDLKQALTIVNSVYGLGGDIQKFLSDLVYFFRNLVLLSGLGVDGSQGLLDMDREQAQTLQDRFAGFGQQTLLQVLECLMKGHGAIARSSTPRLSLEILIVKLCNLKQVVPLEELITRLDKLIEAGASGPDTANGLALSDGKDTGIPVTEGIQEGHGKGYPRPQGAGSGCVAHSSGSGKETGNLNKAARSNQGEGQGAAGNDAATRPETGNNASGHALERAALSGDSMPFTQGDWDRLLEFIKRKRPSLGSYLSCCRLVEMGPDEKNMIHVECPNDMQYDMLSDRENQARISALATECLGRKLVLRVYRSGKKDSGNTGSCPPGAAHKEALLQAPLVQAALEIFNARIRSVEMFSRKERKLT